MSDLSIEYVDISLIKPYENNPRHNDEAVSYVADSIRQFGFKVPIVIDKNNVIITGHTRYKASIQLGLKKIPCLRADDLNEDQVKAFRLIDNRVGEIAEWDFDKLELELEDIDIDLSSFDFEIEPIEEEEEEEEEDKRYGEERLRTDKAYNLDLVDFNNLTNDFWQMPIIENEGYIPERLIGFNYAKTSPDKNCGIHFYLDDYQFERVWNYPEKYLDILLQYDCILSPDFSIYLDMPTPMKIWNIFRSRHIGSYYQKNGIIVIPSIEWGDRETYDFCFQGIPKGSVVAVSPVSMKEKEEMKKIWISGYHEMMDRIQPSEVIVYDGQNFDFDWDGAKIHHFKNEVVDNWKKS